MLVAAVGEHHPDFFLHQEDHPYDFFLVFYIHSLVYCGWLFVRSGSKRLVDSDYWTLIFVVDVDRIFCGGDNRIFFVDVDSFIFASVFGQPVVQYRDSGDVGMGNMSLMVQGQVLLWMQFMYHAKDYFQAFAHSHLKWLCC